MEMSMIEVFEAYKNGTLNFMPMDLVKPESCRVFVESRNVWKEAIFISYTNRGIFAVVDGQNYSDTYKMWCTLENNNEPSGSDTPSNTEENNNTESPDTPETNEPENNQGEGQSTGQETPDDGQGGSPSSDPDGNDNGEGA